MKLTPEDLQAIAAIVRREVQIELRRILNTADQAEEEMSGEEFTTSAAEVFRKHKKVFDALAKGH